MGLHPLLHDIARGRAREIAEKSRGEREKVWFRGQDLARNGRRGMGWMHRAGEREEVVGKV
jgi:hypothetical protein